MAYRKFAPARRPAPLSYGGVDLTAPAPVKTPSFNTGNPNSIASAIGSATDQANAANQQRYTQGLGVLANGANSAQNYITSAITGSAGIGTQAHNRVAQNLQSATGNTLQSAVSRGIGNTTILDSLQRGNQRNAEDANQGIDEQVAQRGIGLKLQQANQANQGAGSIASFIGGRNDVAPDLSMYAGLAKDAAASTAGATRSGTTINAPANYTGSFGGGTGSGIRQPSTSVVNGGSSNYFSNAGGGGSGAGIGGNSGGNYSAGGGAAPGSIASALTGGGSSGSFMNTAGNTQITPLPDAASPTAPASSGAPTMSMTKPGKAPVDIYKFFGIPPNTPLSDENYRTYNKAMGL